MSTHQVITAELPGEPYWRHHDLRDKFWLFRKDEALENAGITTEPEPHSIFFGQGSQ